MFPDPLTIHTLAIVLAGALAAGFAAGAGWTAFTWLLSPWKYVAVAVLIVVLLLLLAGVI